MSKYTAARCLLAALMFVALACGGGGGGGSPTAPPPPTLNIQGTWEGIWVAPITVSLVLTQPQGSRDVTGTISALGSTFNIRGTTNLVSTGNGTFNWETFNAGCGSWSGSMNVRGDLMNGPSRLSTLGCSVPDVIEGPMFVSRRSGGALETTPTPATTGSLEDLVRPH